MPKTKRSEKSISTTLEKAGEKIEAEDTYGTNLQVNPALLAGIKHKDQLEFEEHVISEAIQKKQKEDAFIGRLWFYGGVAVAVGVCALSYRYLKAKPDTAYVSELVNGVASISS
jgi:hypothetical protein